jgi:hypothetical protein
MSDDIDAMSAVFTALLPSLTPRSKSINTLPVNH